MRASRGSPTASRRRRCKTSQEDAGTRLVHALAPLVHPDGDYALMQDTALGIAPTVAQLQARFPALRAPALEAPSPSAGGYHALDLQPGTRLIFDAGPIGPRHQPGHGHAGALSFELSHRGRRLITDTGILTYDRGEARLLDRSTAAHNTVQIDGQNQSEVWAAFRCGRRARVTGRRVDGGTLVGSCTATMGGRDVRHVRRIRASGLKLTINDVVVGRGDHQAVSRLHLAPGIEARLEGAAVLLDGSQPVARIRVPKGDLQMTRTPYHPSFGCEELRTCLEVRSSFADQAHLGWALELL